MINQEGELFFWINKDTFRKPGQILAHHNDINRGSTRVSWVSSATSSALAGSDHLWAHLHVIMGCTLSDPHFEVRQFDSFFMRFPHFGTGHLRAARNCSTQRRSLRRQVPPDLVACCSTLSACEKGRCGDGF